MLEKITIHNMIALDRCQASIDAVMNAFKSQNKINKRTNTVMWIMMLSMLANQVVVSIQDKQIKDLTKEVKELKEMKGE